MNRRLKGFLGVLAVVLLFFINAAVSHATPPRYAEIAHTLHLSTGGLGLALFGETIGLIIVGGLLAWRLAERFGSRTSFGIPLVLFCLSPALIAVAGSGPFLFATQVYQGATNVPLDLAQTTLALALCVRLNRTLMPWFEVAFSVGAVAGSIAGAWSAGRLDIAPYLVGTTVVALALALLAWRFMPTAEPQARRAEQTAPRTLSNRTMWTIAVLAFFSLFAEFLGEEWASVFYDRELHAKTTEFGYGNLSFNAAFIAVLLVGGPLADRLGPALIVRAGGVVFAVGMVAYATSQSVVIATAALAVAGLGAGNLVPLSLSGVQDHPQFKLWVARVTVVMYLGPGASRLVGLMANLTSLRWAIGPTAVAVGLAIVVLGRVLRSSDGNPHNPLPQK